MTDRPKVGGYTYRQVITRGKHSAASIRMAVRRIVEEEPGPITQNLLLARIAISASDLEIVMAELDEIGRNGKQTGQLPPLEE